MEKFVLPERWVVKASNNEEDEIIVPYINQTFRTSITSGLTSGTTPWYYSNIPNKNMGMSLVKHDGSSVESFENCTEITIQQFEHYVLNNVSTSCEHDPELEIILKRLLKDE